MYAKETGTPNTIVFYYAEDTVFNNLSLRTLYRAKNILDKEGNSMVDDYAMSGDEKDAFRLFFETAIYDAFDIVTKMAAGISTDPVFINSSQTIATIVIPNLYGFRIVDNAAYNINVLYGVDDGIRKFVDYHILSSWYELVGLDTELQKWLAQRNEARTDLITRRLFQLRKPLIS